MKFADFQTASFFENPYPVYANLRAEGSIVPIASNMVMTGHYDIVDALLHDRRAGKAYLESVRARYGEAAPEQPVFQSASRMMYSGGSLWSLANTSSRCWRIRKPVRPSGARVLIRAIFEVTPGAA